MSHEHQFCSKTGLKRSNKTKVWELHWVLATHTIMPVGGSNFWFSLYTWQWKARRTDSLNELLGCFDTKRVTLDPLLVLTGGVGQKQGRNKGMMTLIFTPSWGNRSCRLPMTVRNTRFIHQEVCNSIIYSTETLEIVQSQGMGKLYCTHEWIKYYAAIKITCLRPLLTWEEGGGKSEHKVIWKNCSQPF